MFLIEIMLLINKRVFSDTLRSSVPYPDIPCRSSSQITVMTFRWSWFRYICGLCTIARQLIGPAGRPRMSSYNRMKVNALSQHLSFGISRGCAAEGDLLYRAACCGRDGDRDLARTVAAGFWVLFLSTMSSSTSVTSASSNTDTQYTACSVAPLPTDRPGSSV